MDPRITFALEEARKLRDKHGEPEAIDLSIYTSELSLRRGGIQEMSLEEHTNLVLEMKQALEAEGFTVDLHEVPEEK